MDKLENYRLYIQNLLERHSHFKTQDDVENELIFDQVRDRYQLMSLEEEQEDVEVQSNDVAIAATEVIAEAIAPEAEE